jgi:hypothetical protein
VRDTNFVLSFCVYSDEDGSTTVKVFSKDATTNDVVDATAHDFLAILQEDDEPGSASKHKKVNNSSMVVTQTALNGLARYAGRYLQMMHLLPSSAVDIFQCLCQLFDFYLCAVFNGFVPNDERQKVLTKQTKMTAPPPDQSKDFEALQAYMERALNEVVHNNAQPVTKSFRTASDDSAPGDILTPTQVVSPSTRRESGVSLTAAAAAAAATIASPAQSQPGQQQAEVLRVVNILRPPVAIEFSGTNPACFYALNERIVAAESCWFAAKVEFRCLCVVVISTCEFSNTCTIAAPCGNQI